MTPAIDPQSAANWSRAYRSAEGISQRELARLVKCAPGIIGDIERGKIRSRRVARAIMDLVPSNLDGII